MDNKKNINNSITNSGVVKSYYDILDADVSMTKELPAGLIGIYLFIEGDIKDLRIISLN